MNLHDPKLELIQRYADGQATADDVASLEQMLRDEADFRAHFLEYLNLDSALEAFAAAVEPAKPSKTWPRILTIRPSHTRWLAAAVILIGVGLTGWWALNSDFLKRGQMEQLVALHVLKAERVVAAGTQKSFDVGERLVLNELRIASGSLQFRLDSGAAVAVTGPAELQLLDPMHLRVSRGKVTVDIGEHAKGFTVDTGQAHIVDLGTKFGVEVTDANQTDVVVFQGEVELFDQGNAENRHGPMTRLVEGEAVRVDATRQMSRIVNVTAGPGAEDWSSGGSQNATSVITAVRDNWRDPQAKSFYRIVPGGLKEDAVAFIGTRHEWNGLVAVGIPDWLLGSDLVQTFSVDRRKTDLNITVSVSRPAVVYVFFDDRHDTPVWLTKRFTNTGVKIGLENNPMPASGKPVAKGSGAGKLAALSVWKCEMREAGDITLGPPYQGTDEQRHFNWMYGIAARALPAK
jgi:ferric-dicitrate binding protein FerR (iron transport regulator)